MKKLGKIISLAIFSLTLVVCALLTGCTSAATGIVIAANDEPRLVYVQGQELDLSAGKLTVEKEKSEDNETISMDSSEVVVSGYDAEKLGEQVLTVSYNGFETTMKVKVIARVAVTGQKVDYLLGDTFDKSKGTVTIANDDGTTFSVPMSDERISVEGFSSEEVAIPLGLTIKYQSGEVSYTGSFNVAVKRAENIKIILPTSRPYYSHETELDLTGGQIIITFNGKQTAIPIVESMISGFDPSKATVDHRTTPLKQKVTITYAGEEKSYDINIYFSGVSLMRLRASQFEELKWDAENNTIEPDETFGEQAIDAISEYFKLSADEKALLTIEEKEKVVRHAVAYGRVELSNAAAELSKTCFINNGGFVWMTDGEYSDAKKVADVLNNDQSDFVKLGRLLYNIKTEFGATELVPGALIENNVPEAYSEEELSFARNLLDYLLELHEILSVVDKDWTVEDVTSSAMLIKTGSVVSIIANSDYKGLNFSPIYDMLSSWREKDDYFEIVYASYYYGGEKKQKLIKEEMFQTIPLPKTLQQLYINIANGYLLAKDFTNYPTETIWAETLDIFSSYKSVLEIQNEIKQNANDFCKELYEYLDMDAFIENNITFVSSGYEAQAQEMFGDDAFEALWNDYLALFDLVNEKGEIDFDDDATSTSVAAALKSFVEAAPSLQYSFIASMHNKYRDIDRYTRENMLALDYSDSQAKSTFVYLFAVYLQSKLAYTEGETLVSYEDAQDVCEQLFKAIELYALRHKYDTMEDFRMIMEDVKYDYSQLKGAEKTAFDTTFGYCYSKYIALYNKSLSNAKTEFGELSGTVEEMKAALATFFELEEIVKSSTKGDSEKAPVYPLLFAAYEKAAACAAKIYAHGDKDLVYAYYNDEFEINQKMTTLEYALWQARDTFINTMLLGTFTVKNEDGSEKIYRAWTLYEPSGVQEFLAKAYYVMATEYKAGAFDSAKTLQVMEAYRSSDIEIISMFYSLNCDDLYFAGIERFFNTFAEDTKALGLKLIAVEKAYKNYETNVEEIDEFKAAMAEAIEAYKKVVSTDEFKTNLQTMYEFYLEKYEAINN